MRFKIDPTLSDEENIDQAIAESIIYFHSPKYSEPGYDSGTKGILFANWNNETRWDEATNSRITVDDTMERLGELAERAGFETEWSDEWAVCDNCLGAYRTSGDSYSWTKYGNDELCGDCIKADPEEYLSNLEGQTNEGVTIDIDPSDYSYVKLNKESLANGLHEGQADDPRVIGKTLKKARVSRFLFVIDDVGQFDCHFSVFVHEDEYEEAKNAFLTGKIQADDSPASVMKRGLQNAAAAINKMPSGPGVKVVSIQEDGSVKAKLVSPEDFIAGKALTLTKDP